jgi:adenylate cyclase
VIIAPTSDFIQVFTQTQQKILLISLLIFIISIGIFYWIAKRISRPLAQLGQQAEYIKRLEFKEIPLIKSNILEIQLLSKAVQSMNKNINMFAKYVPKGLVKKLLQNEDGVALGGSIQKITLLFSDIANFTTISEKMPPEDLMLHISEYFDEMTQIIMHNSGTIDKYIGDAIMAIWGAPTADDDQVFHACCAAIECQEKSNSLNEKWISLNKPAFLTRIGINCGDAVVGNMGSQDRMSYTAIGDNVNLAARLEGINKIYHTKIIVSECVASQMQNHFCFRILDNVAVKGRIEGIKIYELAGYLNSDENIRIYCSQSQDAFDAYTNQNWDEAIRLYSQFNQDFDDHTARIMIERCAEFKKNPPTSNWNGLTHLTEK